MSFIARAKKAIVTLVCALAVVVCGVALNVVVVANAATDWIVDTSTTPMEEYTTFVNDENGGITNLEDFIAEANRYKFPEMAGAYATEEGNIYLESQDWAGGVQAQYVRGIRAYGDYKDFVVRYKMKYEGKCLMHAAELRASTDADKYWADAGNPLVVFRICEDSDSITTGFSKNGMVGLNDGGWSNTPNITLALDAGDYLEVEIGLINVEGGALFTLKLTNMTTGNSGLAQVKTAGTYPAKGFLALYNSPFNHCFIPDNAEKVMQNLVIEGIEAPALSKWVFAPEVDESYAKLDISEVAPVGADGVTYTYGASDKLDSPNRALFGVKVDKLNYSVAFKMTAENTKAINFSIAMRSAKLGDSSGWKISIKSASVQIGMSDAVTVDLKTGQEYKVEIGCTDYYLEGAAVASGCYVFVKIDDVLTAEAYINPADSEYSSLETGSYLTGILRGDKGGSLTLKPVEAKTMETGVQLTATRDAINVGSKTRFSVKTDLETLFDVVSYEIVEGAEIASIEENALTGNADGKVTVRAKVENAYGIYYSEPIEITVGTGGAPAGGGESDGGCGSVIGGSLAAILAVAAVVVLKKKEN